MSNWRSMIFGILFTLLIGASFADGQVVTGLAWDAPTSNVSGEPIIVESLRYRIYVCDGPILDDRTCIGKLETHDGITELNFSVAYEPTTKKGEIYFRATAYYVDGGNESALSNQVSRPFDVRGTPNAPANLKLTAP